MKNGSRAALVIAALGIGTAQPARAEWDVTVKDIGFGERSAMATAFGNGSGLVFGCESNKTPSFLRMIVMTKMPDVLEGISSKLQISIDRGSPETFAARFGANMRGDVLVTAEIDPTDLPALAERIGGAKSEIAFRILAPDGTGMHSSKVNVSGSRRATSRVLDVCGSK